MKYTITINQSAVFTNGLINKTDLVDWAIIDYLKDFALYKKAKKIRYKGEEYIWLNYQHLINSLPLLQIKGTWTVSRRVSKLRKLGLIKTVKDKDNTLYYTFTDKLIDICFAKESDLKRVRNNASGCLCERPEGARQSHSFAVSKIASAAPRNDNNVLIATDPIAINATDPIAPSATAQYKTKISIINKDYNNKETSFNSSFLKNKPTEKPQMNTDKHRIINNVGQGFSLAKNRGLKPQNYTDKHNTICHPERSEGSLARDSSFAMLAQNDRMKRKSLSEKTYGFKSMSGGIWNVLDNIRQRRKFTAMRDNPPAQSCLAVLTPGGHNDKTV